MMMQILKAGGVEPIIDAVRQADEDNPKGYFELEAIKQVGKNHDVIDPVIMGGKAIKVISTLLPKLPKAHDYKVIFMQRDMDEVICSQQKMLIANGLICQDDQKDIVSRLRKHNEGIMVWAQNAPHIDLLTINHNQVLKRGQSQIERIIEFLAPLTISDRAAMNAAIDPSLYRNRKSHPIGKLFSWVLSR